HGIDPRIDVHYVTGRTPGQRRETQSLLRKQHLPGWRRIHLRAPRQRKLVHKRVWIARIAKSHEVVAFVGDDRNDLNACRESHVPFEHISTEPSKDWSRIRRKLRRRGLLRSNRASKSYNRTP